MRSIMVLAILLMLSATLTDASPAHKIVMNYLPENEFFTSPFIIGEGEGQEFEVQIDTTTSETWVPSVNATYNVTPKYNSSESKTSNTTNKTIEINDFEGDVIGKATFDTVTFGDYSIKNFGFIQVVDFEVEKFTDYPKGKIGLGFKHERGDQFNFIKTLKTNGLINKEMFTIVPKTNELYIGDLPFTEEDNVSMTTCNLTETADLDDDYRQGWVCELTHVFLTDNEDGSLEEAHPFNSRVIFDSAYDYISIPKRHFALFNKSFITPLFNDSCNLVKGRREKYFLCDHNEEAINKAKMVFVLGGHGYVLDGKALFEENLEGKYELLIRFKEEHDDIWALGFPFLDQYNVVYDYEDKTVGFYNGETINLTDEWSLYMNGESPKQKLEKKKLYIILAAVAGFIVLIIIICAIVKCCKKRKSDEHGPLMNQEEVKS